MSYTVLARRYRSSTFDEVVGQEHVAQTLKKAIQSDRIAHAYLFTGTRGVGKTSMARILAKALNCHAFDKATPTPCGTCDSCQRIAKGDDMDVIEIDAASNTGVDNVRDLIENSQYRPSRSRYKVYIIDEVHMLSKAAFNALLKTMEEPPPHVKFILATTEVEKVLPTILSRCQRYDFRNIPTREIAGHLREVCKQEKIAADENALLLVAKAGAGSMRDALSLLDRLLSVGEKKLTTDLIEQMLGLPKSQLLFDLAQAIGSGDIKAALEQTTGMINRGQSVDSLIAALVEHLRNLLILRTCGADSELVEVPGLPLEDLVRQAEQFDSAALVQDVAILEELRRHVRQSQAGRALLDATIVRMAMAEQFAAIGQMAMQLRGQPGTPRSGGRTTPPAATTAVRRAPATALGAESPAAAAQKKKADELTTATTVPSPATPAIASPAKSVLDDIDFGDDDLPRPGKFWEDGGPSLSEMVRGAPAANPSPGVTNVADAPPAAQPVSAAADRPLEDVWQDVLGSFAGQAGVVGALLQMTLARLDDGVAVIAVPARSETFVKMWERNGKRDAIRDALSSAFGRDVGIKFDVEPDVEPQPVAGSSAPQPSTAAGVRPPAPPPRGGPHRPAPPPPPPPSAAPQRITAEQEEAVKAESPLVKALVEKMGGRVVKIE